MRKSIYFFIVILICSFSFGVNAQKQVFHKKARISKTAQKVSRKATASKSGINSKYMTTPSGLKYKILREGTGKVASSTDIVTVNYEGKLLDGTVFDSSYERGEAVSFPLNRVIPGWTEGLQLVKEGGKIELYIPYNLAYGENGVPPVIPPKSDLIFTVELLKVN